MSHRSTAEGRTATQNHTIAMNDTIAMRSGSFFPNGSDSGWLGKIKEAHKKHTCFSDDRRDKESFTVAHYPVSEPFDGFDECTVYSSVFSSSFLCLV